MALSAVDHARILGHVVRWRLQWARRDLDAAQRVPGDPRFMSAREAVRLIPDGATVLTSGLATNARCSVWFYAVRDAYERAGSPRGLYWISAGGQGGRGRIPGTIEELGVPGLLATYCTGHWETVKSLLRLVERGELLGEVLPQGVIELLVAAQAEGRTELVSDTGVGTFVDPRVGTGSPVAGCAAPQLVTPEGDALRYRLPPIDVAALVLPYADARGNVYADDCSMKTDTREAARAAKRNGGRVLVSVAKIVEERPDRVWIPAAEIDAVVVHPWNEQSGSVPQREFWPMFTEGAQVDVDDALARLRLMNRILGITPRRGPMDEAVARLAAWLVAREGYADMRVNIGVGLPEEVCRVMYAAGIGDRVRFLTETGNDGGVPAPGIFFGAMVNPKRIISAPEMFRQTHRHLDVTCLGFLQVDGQGNVNVSKRGPRALDYVGPGGFIDLVRAARTAVFVGRFMEGGDVRLENGRVRVRRPGRPKFVAAVDEVTTSGPTMRALHKTLLYVTNVGAFRLTERGLELFLTFPGVDIERDILAHSGARIVLPPDDDVALAPREVVTGQGFRLALR